MPLFGIVDGLNDLPTFAPVCRLICAENVALVGPSNVVTPPAGIAFVMFPWTLTVGLSATTSNLTLQLPSAGIVPPASETLFAPAAAVSVPPQVVDAFGTGATTMPPAAIGLVGCVVDGR